MSGQQTVAAARMHRAFVVMVSFYVSILVTMAATLAPGGARACQAAVLTYVSVGLERFPARSAAKMRGGPGLGSPRIALWKM